MEICPVSYLGLMNSNFQLQGSLICLNPLSETLPAWLEAQHYSQLFILADEHTSALCLDYLFKTTGIQDKSTVVEIPSGESAKNLHTCEKIWAKMLEARLDRKSLLINLGGGVVGDMGGFCASIWKRGIDFIQIPTTLLAMTDAAIGGKTGIDFQNIKNALGVFRQPAAVFIDPYFLQTLPEREMRSGMAEVIKHAVLGDPELAQILPKSLQVTSGLLEFWQDLLIRSVAVKVKVVAEDPLELHLRKLLNFGHSIGHALESFFLETRDPLTHGEAVYIGMCCEAQFFKGKRSLLEEIQALGRPFFQKRNIDEATYPRLWELMQQDKKNSSGMVQMAIPDERAFSMQLVSPTYSEVVDSLNVYSDMD